MNVLMVNATLDRRTGGGTAVRTLQSAAALRRANIHCTLAAARLRSDVVDDAARAGGEVIDLAAVAGRFRVPWSGWARLRRAVDAADVVLLTGHWTTTNVLAYGFASSTRTPYVICPAGALRVQGRSQKFKRLYNWLCGRRIVAEAAAHIAITRDETHDFAAYGVDPSRVVVIPNGMSEAVRGDGRRFRARHDLGDAPLALFVGRLAPIKGADLLVSAFARCLADRPAWRLVVAGPDDGVLADLEAQVATLGLAERVRFVGFLDEAAKSDAFDAAALVVVPSRSEAMSIVVLEAAAAGRAVLVTDRCGIPEVADSGGGWVVAPNVAALAAGLLEATRDLAALAERGEVWRREALARYSWDRIGAHYIRVLSSVAGSGHA